MVAIVAPAGYGKTTLLAQWKQRENRPVAWLSVDRDDNDPATLLVHLVAAVRRAGMATDLRVPDYPRTPDRVVSHGVARLASLLDSAGTSGVLMLDHVESIRSRGANDLIGDLVAQLPPGVQVAVASRARIRLPLPSLRAQGALFEITAPDLAMDRREASGLLDGAGVEVGEALDELIRGTEGWPTGLYLAGQAISSGSSRDTALGIRGTDRYLADYLWNEVLDHFSAARIAFLTRTSILDRFSGPLCDAVLGAADSARTIERLERSNLLIVPLDRSREWYRYHHLLRDVLQAELIRREPEIVPRLHVRAAEWFDAHGMPESAVAHAQAVGDTDLVARIVERVAHISYGLGKAATVFGWLRWFEQHAERIDRYPAIAALGALGHALAGDEKGADRWGAVLFAARHVADGDAMPASGRVLQALLARDGTRQIRANTRAVRQAVPSANGWLPAALTLEGFSHLWDGDSDRADSLFEQAAPTGEWFLELPAATLALAGRAVIAIGRGDWQAADTYVARSQELIQEHGLHRYLTSGLSYAVVARCAVRRGDIAGGRRLLARIATVRRLLTSATPGISVQTLLELAKAYCELADIAGTREVLREASGILAKRPDLGDLPNQYREIKTRLDTLAAAIVGAPALTAAELRLLPWLATYLSFSEIGERLHVSRHTVKTQAMSIYRKLGASSRSGAVQRATELGLQAGLLDNAALNGGTDRSSTTVRLGYRP